MFDLVLDTAPRRVRRTKDGRLIGRAIRPSAGVQAGYEKRLGALVDEMHNSVIYWLAAAYRRNDERIKALSGIIGDTPGLIWYIDGDEGGSNPTQQFSQLREVALRSIGMTPQTRAAQLDPLSSIGALDARPSADLDEVIRRLRRRWLRRFDQGAQELARYFAKAVWRRSSAELRQILKRAGFAVEFTPGQAVKDALAAIVHTNVSLIRSIPEQHLRQVEASVMHSVLAGRDLASLSRDLQDQYGVTRRRASFIARDQNNKATSSINRQQYLDLRIERAIWLHSHAGVRRRPTHVAMDGQEYDVAKGMWDSHERAWVQPGWLINCRCTSRPILPR